MHIAFLLDLLNWKSLRSNNDSIGAVERRLLNGMNGASVALVDVVGRRRVRFSDTTVARLQAVRRRPGPAICLLLAYSEANAFARLWGLLYLQSQHASVQGLPQQN